MGSQVRSLLPPPPSRRARTTAGLLAFFAPEWGFSNSACVSGLVSAGDKSAFGRLSLHQKFPFPARVASESQQTIRALLSPQIAPPASAELALRYPHWRNAMNNDKGK